MAEKWAPTVVSHENLGYFQPTYNIVDQSERLAVWEDDASGYQECNELGRDINATVLVKWDNQLYHDENFRAMFTDNWDRVNGLPKNQVGRHRNQYFSGFIVRASLDTEHLDAQNADYVAAVSQPTGYSTCGNTVASAIGNQVVMSTLTDPGTPVHILDNPMFARLHDIDLHPDGTRLLTASSSLDLLYELDLEGNILWTMDLWEIDNVNQRGQRFRRTIPEDPTSWLINPNPQELQNRPDYEGANCVLSDPEAYGRLGLPTGLIPVFVNSINYGYKPNEILVTSFFKGEGWKINRATGQIDVVAKGMDRPHALRRDPLLGGYMVSDTGHERVTFLSEDCTQEFTVDFANITGHKAGLEKVRWLQYTTRLADNTYCAILSSRQQIVLFDPLARLKRTITFDPNWGLQLVSANT